MVGLVGSTPRPASDSGMVVVVTSSAAGKTSGSGIRPTYQQILMPPNISMFCCSSILARKRQTPYCRNMFEQISAPNSLKPNKPQYFAVLQEFPSVQGSIGMVLCTISSEAPHGQTECRQALRQAMRMAQQGKKEGLRCRVETVKEELRRGVHVNSLTQSAAIGSPNQFGTLKFRW
jgi:hypothetical protein